MNTAIATHIDSGRGQEDTRAEQPQRNRQYQIAAVALLFAWQILTVVGGYFYVTHIDRTIVAIAGVAQTAGELRQASGVAKAAPGGQDLQKPDAAESSALRADLDQKSGDFKTVANQGHRLGLTLLIGWVLMSVISGHVAFRLLRIANTRAGK